MLAHLGSTFSLLFAMGAFAALIVTTRRARQSTLVYKSALELNQRRLDQQIARINILVRALPNLQSALSGSPLSDGWQTLVLDEARAMIWADGAAYWRYLEVD